MKTHRHSVSFQFGTMLFVDNFAATKSGAIYIEVVPDSSNCVVFESFFDEDTYISFVNNSAGIAGNPIYFSIPQECNIIVNISNKFSLLYVPSLFHYYPKVHSW